MRIGMTTYLKPGSASLVNNMLLLASPSDKVISSVLDRA